MRRRWELALLLAVCALVFYRAPKTHSPVAPIPPQVPIYQGTEDLRNPEANFLFNYTKHHRSGQAAIDGLNRVLNLEPNSALVYYDLADAYFEMARYPESIQKITMAIQLQPGFAAAWNNRAYTRAMLNDPAQWELGLIDARTALGLAPKEATYYDTRGFLLLRLGRADEALPDMDLAVSREYRPEHLLNRARVLDALGRRQEAAEDRSSAARMPSP